MKKFIFILLLGLFTVGIANADPGPKYQENDSLITVVVDQLNDVFVATVDLKTLKVVEVGQGVDVNAYVRQTDVKAEVLVIITKTKRCQYAYIASKDKKHITVFREQNKRSTFAKATDHLGFGSGGLPYNQLRA